MVEIIVKEAELPIVGHIAACCGQIPRLGVWLIAAHHQPADLFLEIGAPVRVAQGGRIGCKAGDRIGDDVLMFDGLQRHRDARHRPDLPRPLARAIDHLFAGDRALGRVNSGDPRPLHRKARDADAFNDPRAMHPRALGKALRDVRGASLPVGRQPACADQIAHLHQGPHLLDLGRRDQVHLHPEAAGGGGKALVFRPAVLIGGKPQAAGHLPARLQPSFGIQPLVKIDRVFQHLGDRGRRAQLPHQPRRMPGGAGGQLALLQQHHIGLVVAGQMIGGGAADNAPPDNDDLSFVRQGHGSNFP